MTVIKLEQVRWTGQPRRVEGTPRAESVPADRVHDKAAAGARAAVGASGAAIASVADATGASAASVAAQAEIQRLRAELAQQRASHLDELDRLRQQARIERDQASAGAHAEGVEQGLAMATRSDAAQAAALREGLARLQHDRADLRRSLDSLAVGVARLALRALLGHADWRADALAQAVARLSATLLPEAPLRVRISAVDFPDTGPLRAALNQTLPGAAAGGFELVADPELEPGACLVEQSGTRLDISLKRQLDRVEALLAAEGSHG